MEKGTRIAALLCAGLMLSAGLAGCKADASPPDEPASQQAAPGAGPVVLEYYTWDTESDYIPRIVELFNNSQPRIQVNLTMLPDGQYEAMMPDLLDGGDTIDIITVRGNAQLSIMHQDGRLLDLTELLQASNINVSYWGNMFSNTAIDGHYYAVPARTTLWVLFYNKAIFDEAGLAYPGQMTWDEYVALADSLTIRENGETVQWGGHFVPWICWFSGAQQGRYLTDDDVSLFRDGLAMMNQMYNIDASHTGHDDWDKEDAHWLHRFESGTVAMLPQGEWAVGMLMPGEKVDWDIAPIPIFEGQQSNTTWGGYNFISINAECRYVPEAFEFLSFVSGEQGAVHLAESGIIGGYDSPRVQEIYKETTQGKNVDVFFDAYKVQDHLVYPGYDALISVFNEEATLYFEGGQTLEECMESYLERREALLNP